MISLRIVASLVLVALARAAAAQAVPADSLAPGTPVRVVLRTSERAPLATTSDGSIANPGHGQSHGIIRARFDSWDGTALHVTEPQSGMSWSFPGTEVGSVDARTHTDRSRSALIRGALIGAVVGAVGVYYYNAYRDQQFNKFAFGAYAPQMLRGAAIGFAIGGVYRYERPAGRWQPVQPPPQAQ